LTEDFGRPVDRLKKWFKINCILSICVLYTTDIIISNWNNKLLLCFKLACRTEYTKYVENNKTPIEKIKNLIYLCSKLFIASL